jgi:diacylglycerol kinase (ATP)
MPSRAIAAVRYALRGIGFMLAERNCQVLALATLAALAAGAYFRLAATEWCAVVLAITAMWVAEGLNTAIERLTDLVSPGYHPLAGMAKDIAAGAVLIASVNAVAIGYLVFAGKAADKTARVLDKIRNAPAEITVIALVLTVLVVIATKAWTGRGTPLRGGLPSGHAAIGFAGWMALTYIVNDSHRFLVSALTFIMALLIAQTRVESGVHSALEVAYGGALGALVTLVVFQLL